MDLYTPPSVAYGGAYAIRPYGWVCAALQKTILFSSPSGPLVGRIRYALTTGYVRPSKNSPVFVLFGDACGAYAIRPYGWVRAILRNTDAILQLGTCGPSKNYPVFVPYRAVCGAYAIRPTDRVCAILRNTDAMPQSGTCEGSKNGSVFATVGDVWWAYSIRPYDRVRVMLRNTDTISRLEGRGRLGCGAVGATVCGGDGRE